MKPAEDTPLTAEALLRLAHRVGIPEHVLQLVTCSRDNVGPVGHQLTTHADVRKVSFTGSTAVGKRLTHAASQTMKRCVCMCVCMYVCVCVCCDVICCVSVCDMLCVVM